MTGGPGTERPSSSDHAGSGSAIARAPTNGRVSLAGRAGRGGFAILEIALVLVALAALAPPVWSAAARVRERFLVRDAREEAARLFAAARWTAIADGGATVVLASDPPSGTVVSATGDTVAFADLGRGGLSLTWTGRRAVTFGPLGLGRVASRTLTFSLGEERRRLVVSTYGRVSRR